MNDTRNEYSTHLPYTCRAYFLVPRDVPDGAWERLISDMRIDCYLCRGECGRHLALRHGCSHPLPPINCAAVTFCRTDSCRNEAAMPTTACICRLVLAMHPGSRFGFPLVFSYRWYFASTNYMYINISLISTDWPGDGESNEFSNNCFCHVNLISNFLLVVLLDALVDYWHWIYALCIYPYTLIC